ncbi:MAG: MotA/TolQ/ExbB proton channel family protein [Planctomycetota bacterium]
MKKWLAANWKPAVMALGMALIFTSTGFAAEEGGGAGKQAPTLLDNMKEAGFMEYILLFVSIAGLALCLQALVSIRAHLLRPPELSIQLLDLCSQGDIQGALDAAQADGSFLGAVSAATLNNHQYGKEAMEGAMSDMGEIESNKVMNKIGTLNLIAAIAPMLGLTGTTVGMMATFSAMSAGGSEITPDKMAKGISIALVCTFTGLMVAIPLLVVSFILKTIATKVTYEIVNDINEMIRITTSGGGTEEAA